MDSLEASLQLRAQAEPGAQAPWDVWVADDLEEAFLDRMMRFLRLYMPAGTDPVWSVKYFQWKLGDANPAGRGFLTCAVAGDEVVGVTSVTPKRLWVRHRLIVGAEIGDTFTHPDYLRKASGKQAASQPGRGSHSSERRPADYVRRSIFGRLVTETKARALARGIRIIYGTPNKLSRPGYEKHLNFRSHPTHHNMTFIRPTARGLVQRHRILGSVSWFLSGAEAGVERLTRQLARLRAGRRYVVGQIECASGALDDLWDRLKGQWLFALVRDRAYFQHRFFEHPLARYTVYTASREGQLQGLLVTRVMVTSWGKRYCCIADWCVDESQPRVFPLLLTHAIHACDRRQVDGVQLWCSASGHYPLLLRQLGFLRVGESPVILFLNAEGNEVLHTCPMLNFTLASSDNV